MLALKSWPLSGNTNWPSDEWTMCWFRQQMALCITKSIHHLADFEDVERCFSINIVCDNLDWNIKSNPAVCSCCCLQSHTALTVVNYSCQSWDWDLGQVFAVVLVPVVLETLNVHVQVEKLNTSFLWQNHIHWLCIKFNDVIKMCFVQLQIQ